MQNLRDTLAVNLRALMDARPDLDTQQKIAEKTGLSQSTVNRILSRAVDATIGTVAALAAAYRVHPVKLLSPQNQGGDLQSRDGPQDYDEAALLRSWRQLGATDRHRVMSYLCIALSASEAEKPAAIVSHDAPPLPAPAAAARAASRHATVRSYGESIENADEAKPRSRTAKR